ncbi:MAG: tetratricopeptide repeat protein [Bacteroidales bacterium]|nr:tetratricopeptide repeat protein [Bacteroidales bacterium]
MRSSGYRLFLLAAVLGAVAGLVSCSPNRNNAATRKYQEFITRYNIYYNGDTHYRETLADMESKYEDDYSRLVLMHPVESKADNTAPQPSGNFNRSIEKAQKAIQVRSIKKKPARKPGKSRDPKYKEWMKRDEYNPFLHNAWMMMGRGQFYNGDFLGAASTFFYISRHFTWLPATVTEAKLMQSLAYIALGWQFEAEMILTRVRQDDLTSSALRRLYDFAYADFYIHAHDYEAALPYLQRAVKSASGAQKTRLTFLLGQLYERLDRKADAYKAYAAAGASGSASYRTKFNARIKQSEVYAGADIEPEVKALRRMTRYDRNKEYLDQIYYAIGNLYLSRGDTLHAIENYELANEKSTRNGIDKAINQLRLGSLYFDMRNYEKAQPNYTEAVPLLPASYPDYDNIRRRSEVLDELAVYSQNVNLQDSLLRLSAMTPEQRLEVINKIIDELKEREKKEAEEARRQEYLANQAAQGNNMQDNTQSFQINSDNSWYFYNTATKNAGKTEFQKRWGSRKLEDDWRRRNKTTFNTDDFDADDTDDETEAEAADTDTELTADEKDRLRKAEDPHYPEYYLAQIPETDAEKATAHEVIQDGLYNMGVILKDKLEDFGAARAEFDRLLADYPDNVYRLDVYYNLYLMYMRLGQTDLAEFFRRLILEDFPESTYGIALRDPNYIENLRRMDAVQQQMYTEAYDAYLADDNAEVHRIFERMEQQYPLSPLMPKFMFLHALAYVTEKRSDEFNSTLRTLLERYPDTDLTPYASAWLKGMAQGRELQSGQGNMRGMIWDLRLTNDSTATDAGGPAEFLLDQSARQLLVFTFPTDQVSSNQLLYEIARHNFRSFVVKDFDLEQMNFGRLGMIIINGFDGMDELNHYRRVMADNPDFRIPAGVRPVAISREDFDLLLTEGRSFEEYFRYRDEMNYIDTQADLLMPEEIETLPEAEAAEAAQTIVVIETPEPESDITDEEIENEVLDNMEESLQAPAPGPLALPQPDAKPDVKPELPAPGGENDPVPLPDEDPEP